MAILEINAWKREVSQAQIEHIIRKVDSRIAQNTEITAQDVAEILVYTKKIREISELIKKAENGDEALWIMDQLAAKVQARRRNKQAQKITRKMRKGDEEKNT